MSYPPQLPPLAAPAGRIPSPSGVPAPMQMAPGPSPSGPVSEQIRFQVVHSTSSEDEYPASELENKSPHTKGWQSARFCEYPQDIVLRLERVSDIRQIQILSHQSKIATRIEIAVGNPTSAPHEPGFDDFTRAKFKRLGYLSLDSNQRSQLKCRELKSVYVNARALFLKFTIEKCHVNAQNLFNQVSIIAINVLGTTSENAPLDDLSVDMVLDEKTARHVRQLNLAKKQAISQEDYDEAKRLKAAIEQLTQLGTRIAQLERKKAAAVKQEDYDAAKALKEEIQRMHASASIIASGGGPMPGPPPHASPSPSHEGPGPSYNHNPYAADGEDSRPVRGRVSNPVSARKQPEPSFDDGDRPIRPAPSALGGLAPLNRDDQPLPAQRNREEQPLPALKNRNRGPGMMNSDMSEQPSARPPAVSADDRPLPALNKKGGGGAFAVDFDAMDAGPPPAAPPKRAVGKPAAKPKASPAPVPAHTNGDADPADPVYETVNASPDRYDRNDERPLHINAKKNAADPFASTDPFGTGQMGGMGAGVGAGAGGGGDEEADPEADGDGGGAVSADGLTPEELSPANSKDAEGLIPVFGDHTVKSLYSKQWVLRESAFTHIQTELGKGTYAVDREQLFHLLCRVTRTGLKDKVAKVFLSAVSLTDTLITTFPEMLKSEARRSFDRHVASMVDKLGDSNARVRSTAVHTLTTLTNPQNCGPAIIADALLKPLSKKEDGKPQPLKGRAEMLLQMIPQYGLNDNSGLNVAGLMNFALPLLSHRDAAVRGVGVELVTAVYLIAGAKKLIPYVKTLRPGLKQTLEASFSKAGAPMNMASLSPSTSQTQMAEPGPPGPAGRGKGKPAPGGAANPPPGPAGRGGAAAKGGKPGAGAAAGAGGAGAGAGAGGAGAKPGPGPKGKAGGAPSAAATPANKQAAGQANAAAKKGAPGAGTPSARAPANAAPAAAAAPPPAPAAAAQPPIQQQAPPASVPVAMAPNGVPPPAEMQGAEPVFAEEGFCQYCGFEDPSLTAEALDMHYWQACPMLTTCRRCEQVIEISTITEHLVSECDFAAQHKICPRCQEAVIDSDWEAHLAAANCPVAVSPEVATRCALCHQDIPGMEQGWIQHLLSECPNNERRNLNGKAPAAVAQ